MEYRVLVPFATNNRAYTTGEIVTGVEDADNLVLAGIIEVVEVEQTEAPRETRPSQKKRSVK